MANLLLDIVNFIVELYKLKSMLCGKFSDTENMKLVHGSEIGQNIIFQMKIIRKCFVCKIFYRIEFNLVTPASFMFNHSG